MKTESVHYEIRDEDGRRHGAAMCHDFATEGYSAWCRAFPNEIFHLHKVTTTTESEDVTTEMCGLIQCKECGSMTNVRKVCFGWCPDCYEILYENNQ